MVWPKSETVASRQYKSQSLTYEFKDFDFSKYSIGKKRNLARNQGIIALLLYTEFILKLQFMMHGRSFEYKKIFLTTLCLICLPGPQQGPAWKWKAKNTYKEQQTCTTFTCNSVMLTLQKLYTNQPYTVLVQQSDLQTFDFQQW